MQILFGGEAAYPTFHANNQAIFETNSTTGRPRLVNWPLIITSLENLQWLKNVVKRLTKN